MTARELVSQFRFRDQSLSGTEEFFLYLANHVYEARLSDGQRLNDGTDFAMFLRELADALEGKLLRPFGSSVAHHATCPRCGHVHEGISECGIEIGGGRICRCELSVPA
jgi:hypothetical protein